MGTAPPVLRTALGGVALAAAVTAIAPYLDQHPAAVVLPSACPAAPELLGVLIARLWPSAPLGLLLHRADVVLIALGLTCLVVGAQRLARSWPIALAIAVAASALPVFAPVLAPFRLLMLVVPAATLCLFMLVTEAPARRARLTVAALMATAAILPATTLPLAAMVIWLRPVTIPRSGAAGSFAAAMLILLAGTGALWLVPSLPGGTFTSQMPCLVPGGPSLANLLAAVQATTGMAGPYVCGLAVLGLVARRHDLVPPERRLACAYAGIVVATSLWSPQDVRTPSFPVVLLLYWSAAAGIREMVLSCAATLGGRLAAVLLVLLVPLLQLSARAHELAASEGADLGHARLSREGLSALVVQLPAGAALVTEDALTDVLLRARMDRGPAIARVLPRLPADMAASLDGAYAGPAAQLQLQQWGIRVTDVAHAPGLARLERGGDCRVLRTSWQDLSNVASSDAFTFAGAKEADAGPLVLYASFSHAPDVRPLGWSKRALRGFSVNRFDTDSKGGRAELLRAAADDHAPLARVDIAPATHFIRLEVWRTPGAPLALSATWGDHPVAAMGRVRPGEAPGDQKSRLTVCPAFPHDVLGFR